MSEISLFALNHTPSVQQGESVLELSCLFEETQTPAASSEDDQKIDERIVRNCVHLTESVKTHETLITIF